MPETPRTETTSLLGAPEDKSLQPTEDKTLLPAADAPAAAPLPAGDEPTAIVLVHHYEFEGKDVLPGEQIKVPARTAEQLVRASWATYPA